MKEGAQVTAPLLVLPCYRCSCRRRLIASAQQLKILCPKGHLHIIRKEIPPDEYGIATVSKSKYSENSLKSRGSRVFLLPFQSDPSEHPNAEPADLLCPCPLPPPSSHLGNRRL